MNTVIWNHNRSVGARPERFYTQHDVDKLRENWESGQFSEAKEIQKETQIAGRVRRLGEKVMASLVKKSNTILVRISSHAFPFDFFPSTMNVEEGRITIINRHFLSSEIHSVDIKDISNIFINTSIFLSQLVIISKTFENNEVEIRNLRTREAVYARRIIEGLRIFTNKQIDTSGYTKREMIAKLEELSTTKIVR